MADDLSLGLDVSSFSEDKKKTLAEFLVLFEKLNAFDGSKVSPLANTGIAELNASIKTSNELLAELNAGMAKLGGVTTAYYRNTESDAKKVASVDKQRLQEAIQLIKIRSDMQKRLDAQEQQSLKLSLEQTKKNIQQQIEGNKQIEAAEKKRLDESLQYLKLREDMQKRLNAVEGYNNKDAKQSEAVANKRLEQSEKDLAKTKNEAAEASARETRRLRDEARAAFELTNDYKQLKQAVKDKEAAYANALINTGKDSETTKAAFADLQRTNDVVNKVQAGFEKADGNAFQFGKTLTGALSSVRTLAYILPGIGIAGIFNLAFEAIENVAESLGLFNNRLEIAIAFQKALAENADKVNKSIKEQSDLFKSSGQENVNYYDRIKTLSEATGASYEHQIDEIDKFNKAKKEQSDQYVKDLDASVTEQFKLNADLLSVEEQRRVILEKIADTEKKITEERAVKIDPLKGGITSQALTKSGKIAGLEENKEAFAKQLDVFDSQVTAMKGRLSDITDAINDQINSNTAIQEEEIKRAKFFEDERKKLQLNRIKNAVDSTLAYNDQVLKSEKNGEVERLNALKNELEARQKLINSTRNAVLYDSYGNDNTATTDADKKIARGDALEATKENLIKFNNEVQNLKNEFLKRDLKATLDINQQILDDSEKHSEAVYKNEKEGLDKRLKALIDNVSARRRQIEDEYTYELIIAELEGKLDSERDSIKAKRNSAVGQLKAGTAENISGVISSYGTELFRGIKENNKALQQGTADEKDYTAELSRLNDELERGAISYKEYTKNRKILEDSFTLAQDVTNINVLKQQVKGDQKANADLNAIFDTAELELAFEKKQHDKDELRDAQAKYDSLKELKDKSNRELLEAEKKLAEAQAKYEDDKHKTEASAMKEIESNWLNARTQAFDLARTIADSYYAHQEELIQRNIELVDKQYENEIDAINKSSLSQKDKIANDTQLKAQKEYADLAAEKKIRKEKHNNAVIDRDIAIANIIWETERAIMSALATPLPPPIPENLAISRGIIGGIALAKAIAEPVPAYRFGTESHPGGRARIGEGGKEIVIEPGKDPYEVNRDVIKYLPKGTEVIPTYPIPQIREKRSRDDSWQQTKY